MRTKSTRKRPALLLGLVLTLMLLVAACGKADTNVGSGAAPTPTPEPTEEAAQNAIVVQIKHVGGFVMQEMLVTRLPVFTLYDDGRVITEGPQIAIYPPPALPNLQQGTITSEGIELILQAAEDAGLLEGDKHYSLDMIADAATTVFTVYHNGEMNTVSAYALGVTNDGDIPTEFDIPAEEVEAREKLAEFQSKMLDYMNWLPEETIQQPQSAFPIEQLQVVVQPRNPDAMGDDSIDPGEAEWPLETPLAEIGEPYPFIDQASCAVIEGKELDSLLTVLKDANQLTVWISEGEEYSLLIRPLLPAEAGCQEPDAGQQF